MVDRMSSATTPSGVDELARRVSSDDPRVGLRAVGTLRRVLGRIEELHVRRARELGMTWLEIGDELGISKQATHKRFARIEKA